MNPEILALAKEAGCTYWNDEDNEMDKPLECFYYLAQAKALEDAADSNEIDSYHAYQLREMAAQKRKEAESC